MKGTYRGCEIEVWRDECEFLTFAIFDDGYEVTSGFSVSPPPAGSNVHLSISIVITLSNSEKNFSISEIGVL